MIKPFRRLNQMLQLFLNKWILPDLAVLSFCLLLLAITWGAAGWQMDKDRANTIDTVIRDNDKFSLAFEEHVRRIIKTNHQYLDIIKREYEATQTISPSLRRMLTQMALDPVLVQAVVADSQGQVVASILPYSVGTKIGEMPYFRLHEPTDIWQLYIGSPLRDPDSDKRLVHLSRRLNRPDGSFAGIAAVAIDPDYFTKFYQDMSFDNGYVVRLVGRDGIVCASNNAGEIGIAVDQSKLFEELDRDSSGFYRAEDEPAGSAVLMGYRTMYDYPFLIQFGVLEETLVGLFQRRAGYITAAGGISFFILLYAVILIRSARRLRQSEAVVQASYEELSAAHEQLVAVEEEVRAQYDELMTVNHTLMAQEDELNERDERLRSSYAELTEAHQKLSANEEELRTQYMELLRANQQSERQNAILSSLQETAFGLLNKLDMEQLLQTIVNRAARMVGASDAFITLPSEDETMLEVKAGIGIYGGEVLRIPLQWGLMGKVYTSGKARVVDNYASWAGRASLPNSASIHAIFAAPLRAKRKVAGVFGVAFCESGRRFDEDQIMLLEHFAELASLALENASLHSSLQNELDERSKSETTLSEILNATHDVIIINDPADGSILWTNPRTVELFGHSEEELKRLGPVLISTPANLEVAKAAMRRAVEEGAQLYERETVDKFGRRIDVEVNARRAVIDGKVLCLTMMRDITDRKQMEGEIAQIQTEKQALFDAIPDEMVLLDAGGHILASRKPQAEAARFVEAGDGLVGRHVSEFVREAVADDILECVQRAYESGEAQQREFVMTSGSEMLHWDARFFKVGSDKVLVMLRDITAIRRSEKRVEYLSLHDSLTGVYNRTYFEAEMLRLERREEGGVAILMCDVDGLKLINDTLGHRAGDDILRVIASALQSVLSSADDIVARIGGDEFAVILFSPYRGQVEDTVCRIQECITKYNRDNPHLPVSLSIGWAVDYENCKAAEELFKHADHDMYRQKMHQGQSVRSAIVQTMMKALEARDFITEGHAQRLQDLVEGLGRKVRLTNSQIADLRLFAKFHDIGKVGIPDNVLNKPGKLDEEEKIIMRRHSEIGFRIAQASSDLTPIADWILKHQEWWNGQGYPLGISGAEIPLACRILALADAFDAMTSDRPYRAAMPADDALAEIEQCAGSQFDPELAALFVAMIKSKQSFLS